MIKKDKLDELKKYRYAHRGLHDKPLIAENSLTAFKRAAARGFGAELDIHLLTDGKLAVFHDSDLKRITGHEGTIEKLSSCDLPFYKLEQSQDSIPLLEDVLSLRLPLIVELKVADNNDSLCEKAWEALKDYDAPWCMESFNPYAVLWFKKHHPDVIRGQLSQNFMKEGEVFLTGIKARIMTDLMCNPFTKPDFVAYNFADRDNKALKRYLKRGGCEVSWTIRSKSDLIKAEAEGCIPIFEKFDPEENI